MNNAAELGPRMRAERERRGISLQQAADDMRLDSWVVEALEQGQFDKIGAAVYAKGHLKKYAALLELPWGEIAAVYESLKVRTVEPAELEPQVQIRASSLVLADLPRRLFGAAAIVVLLFAGLLWWKPWRARAPHAMTVRAASIPPASAASSAAAAPPARPAAAASHGATSRRGGEARRDAAVDVADATAAVTRSSTIGAHLRLTFTADSWVDVRDAAGKRLLSGLSRADTVRTVAGEAPLRVVLGFERGVQVRINDQAAAVQPRFVSGNVAKFTVGADGSLSRYALNVRAQGAL